MDYLPSKLRSPPNSHISNKGPAKWKSKLSAAGWKSPRPVTEFMVRAVLSHRRMLPLDRSLTPSRNYDARSGVLLLTTPLVEAKPSTP